MAQRTGERENRRRTVDIALRRLRQDAAARREQREQGDNSDGMAKARASGHFGRYPSRRSPNSTWLGSRSICVVSRLRPVTSCRVCPTSVPTSLSVCSAEIAQARPYVLQFALQDAIGVLQALGGAAEIAERRQTACCRARRGRNSCGRHCRAMCRGSARRWSRCSPARRNPCCDRRGARSSTRIFSRLSATARRFLSSSMSFSRSTVSLIFSITCGARAVRLARRERCERMTA